MREIKFRVYSPLGKKFLNSYKNKGLSFLDGSDKDMDEFGSYPLDQCFDLGFIVQQYTGLNDLTGKEIYEGDLVELHTDSNDHTIGVKENHCGLYEIHWDRKYKLKQIKPNWFFQVIDNDCANFNIMKVVGNIFENPELLK